MQPAVHRSNGNCKETGNLSDGHVDEIAKEDSLFQLLRQSPDSIPLPDRSDPEMKPYIRDEHPFHPDLIHPNR